LPEQSFYFRGPESKLNLRAHNLRTVLQLAEGIDDETWMYHLRKGDYSGWFSSIIKDAELGRQTAEVESARASGVLGQSVSPLVKQTGDLKQFCRRQTLTRQTGKAHTSQEHDVCAIRGNPVH
jgi:hypothetical protein